MWRAWWGVSFKQLTPPTERGVGVSVWAGNIKKKKEKRVGGIGTADDAGEVDGQGWHGVRRIQTER